MTRYKDIKQGGEKAADKDALSFWCSIFRKSESDEDREWVDNLVEDIDSDLERYFDTKYWPGELESLGSAHLNADGQVRN